MKRIVRETKETRVEIRVGRSTGPGLPPKVTVDTTQPFFDHMLATLLKYAGLAATVKAKGDLSHHLMEDVALTLGRAVREITPATAARFGERTIVMDDALVFAAIDVGGRPFYVGELPNRLYSHVLRSFAQELGAGLHVRVLDGHDRHHIIEAAFKATGLALRQALGDGGGDVFSTKGTVDLKIDTDEPEDEP